MKLALNGGLLGAFIGLARGGQGWLGFFLGFVIVWFLAVVFDYLKSDSGSWV